MFRIRQGGVWLIEVREVKSLRDLRKFIKFPYQLYRKNPYWIPPLLSDEWNTLRRDKNPAFAYCEAKYWLAYKDGKLAGRIAGIINHSYIEKWGQLNARFGWLDFIDDPDVCQVLLGTVENWARTKELNGIQGPLGFCDLDKEGMLVDGFAKRGTMITLYNHPYYPVFLEKCGYQKDVDWVEFQLQIPERVPEKIDKVAQIAFRQSGLNIVHTDKSKELLPYAEGIFELLNQTYKDLYGVVPLTKDQIQTYIKQYFSYVNPDYICVLTDKEGQVAAFGIAMPSLSKAMQNAGGRIFPIGFWYLWRAMKNNKKLDAYLIGVRKNVRAQGAVAIILKELTEKAIANGIESAETAPMLEKNLKVTSLWKYYDMQSHKRRRSYYKDLSFNN